MGLFKHLRHSDNEEENARISYRDHEYTIEEFVNEFNGVLNQFDGAKKNLATAQQQIAKLQAQNKQLRQEVWSKIPVAELDQFKEKSQEQLDQVRADFQKQLQANQIGKQRLQFQLHQLQVAQSQAEHQSQTVIIDGQRWAVTALVDRYHQINQQIKEINDQVSALQAQVKKYQVANQKLQNQLAQVQTVNLNGQRLTIKELATRYHHLQVELTNLRQHHDQSISTNSSQPIDLMDSSQKKLVTRYYKLVQAVLGEYQNQINRLQLELTDRLKGASGTGFLQLEDRQQAAQDYQQELHERNQQLISYIENHQHEEKLVRKYDRQKNESEELRGLRYWGNLVWLYRRTLKKLLTRDEKSRHLPSNIYPYDKATAQHIGESKPSYLTSNNKQALNTVLGGIKDEQAWQKQMKKFYQDAGNTLKGMTGERLVANVVRAYDNNHVITSMNLPFKYHHSHSRGNQIDCIVVNTHGIFILEVKNYKADTITIDKDGCIMTQRGEKTYKNQDIVHQGQLHYKAVVKALTTDQTLKYHMKYLQKQVHVLYISANSQTKIKSYQGTKHYCRFLSLDGLRSFINSAHGNLRPDIIQKVVNALVDQQGGERAYEHLCLPDKPDDRANHAWRQYTTMRKLLRLKLDDLVQQRDPDILNELQDVGLQADNGYVVQIRQK